MNKNTKINFKLLNGSDVTAQKEFIIKDMIYANPSFWQKSKDDFEVFINLCLNKWCGQMENDGILYNVGTFEIVDMNDLIS